MLLSTILFLATLGAPVGARDLDDTVLRHPQSDHITCLDWWLAVQEGIPLDAGEYMSTARVAIHLIGGGTNESTEGAWGSTGDAALTMAVAFQDDRSLTEARRAAFEAFWAYDRYSASIEVLYNDAAVGDSSPWSATATSMLTSQLEAGLRFEDDELKERTTLALSKYLNTRSSRWSVESVRSDLCPPLTPRSSSLWASPSPSEA